MRYSVYLSILYLLLFKHLSAQVLFKTSWQGAGASLDYSTSSNVVNVITFGAVGDSATDCRNAINQAIASLAGSPGVIYFPAGKFRLTRGISLPDGVVIRGKNSRETSLIFDFGTSGDNGISINGSKDGAMTSVAQDAVRGAARLVLTSRIAVKTGDYLLITQDNPWETVPVTTWALRSPGQLVAVKSVRGNEVFLAEPLNISLTTSLNPKVQIARPKQFVGIENIRLRRMANAAGVPCNISFTLAANCWVKGIESNFSASSHIMAAQSAHLTIRGNYIHDGFVFDGSGTRGYGVTFIQQTTNCLVEDNIFRRLRHALTCKEGANGNVMAYNYCREPFRTEFPSDGGADCLLHGFWPTANLYEGNIGQFFQASATWGPAGPHNTIFRNRFLNYGIYGSRVTTGSNSIQSDSTNIWANESTAMGTFMGYPLGVTLWESNTYSQFANYAMGQLQPFGSQQVPEASATSLYRSLKPDWWPSTIAWGKIGWPNQVSQATIPAFNRWFDSGVKTVEQSATTISTRLVVTTWQELAGRFKSVEVKAGGAVNFVATTTIDSVLIIRSGATAIFNNASVNGVAMLTIEQGANVIVNSPLGLWRLTATSPLKLTGALQVANNSNWYFSGQTAQSTGDLMPDQVNNLVVNCSTTLELAKSVQVNNELLLLSGQLNQTANATLTLSHSATIPQVMTGAGLSNGQFTTVIRRWSDDLRTMRGSWVFASPVVAGQRIVSWAQNNPFVRATFGSTGTGSVYLYDPSAPAGRLTNGYIKPDSANQVIGLGTGARVWVSPQKPASEFTVKGSPQIGPLTVPLKYCSQNCNFQATNGWNFVGNPYLAAISWSKITGKTNMSNAIHSWDWRNKRWRTFVNGIGTFSYDGAIAPGEGFMVCATGLNASLTFEETAKAIGQSHVFNDQQSARLLYSIRILTDDQTDEVILYHDPMATQDFDPQLDAKANSSPLITLLTADGTIATIKAFNKLQAQLLTINQRSNLHIDSLPAPQANAEWILRAVNNSAVRYRLGSGLDVTLESVETGTYSLEQQPVQQPGLPLLVWPNPCQDQVQISVEGSHELVVADLSGRLMYSRQVSGSVSIKTAAWPSGIYLVRYNGLVARLIKQ